MLSEDVERVAAMREHLGDGFPLMARRQHEMDGRPGDPRGAGVRARSIRSGSRSRSSPTISPAMPASCAKAASPSRSGENLRSLWDFRDLITQGGVTYPEPDVTNCGGVTSFMKIARLAEAFNLPVTSHGAHDVTVQLLAACPNRSYLEAHGFGLERYIEEPLVIADGCAVAPDRPGPWRRVRLAGARCDSGLSLWPTRIESSHVDSLFPPGHGRLCSARKLELIETGRHENAREGLY